MHFPDQIMNKYLEVKIHGRPMFISHWRFETANTETSVESVIGDQLV